MDKTFLALSWSAKQVCQWLFMHDFADRTNVFLDNGIHGAIIPYLTEGELEKDLGISDSVERKRLWRDLQSLINNGVPTKKNYVAVTPQNLESIHAEHENADSEIENVEEAEEDQEYDFLSSLEEEDKENVQHTRRRNYLPKASSKQEESDEEESDVVFEVSTQSSNRIATPPRGDSNAANVSPLLVIRDQKAKRV